MSINESLDMGRYAFYVWASYGLTAALLIIEFVLLRQRRRTIVQRLGRMIRMEKREQVNET